MVVLAAIGGFVAGMLWFARIPVLNPVEAYCRGNVEGYRMATPGEPNHAALAESEANCFTNLTAEPGYLEQFGYRGPLRP